MYTSKYYSFHFRFILEKRDNVYMHDASIPQTSVHIRPHEDSIGELRGRYPVQGKRWC